MDDLVDSDEALGSDGGVPGGLEAVHEGENEEGGGGAGGVAGGEEEVEVLGLGRGEGVVGGGAEEGEVEGERGAAARPGGVEEGRFALGGLVLHHAQEVLELRRPSTHQPKNKMAAAAAAAEGI